MKKLTTIVLFLISINLMAEIYVCRDNEYRINIFNHEILNPKAKAMIIKNNQNGITANILAKELNAQATFSLDFLEKLIINQ